MTALTADELMAWVEHTSLKWRALLTAFPEALSLPCDIRESNTVRDVVHHIVAVELRYAQRLSGLTQVNDPAVGDTRGRSTQLLADGPTSTRDCS